MIICVFILFFFYVYGDHRDLHVLTHSFPTRRSSDLVPVRAFTAAGQRGLTTLPSGSTRSSGARQPALFGASGASERMKYSAADSTAAGAALTGPRVCGDRKSTRLNSSH